MATAVIGRAVMSGGKSSGFGNIKVKRSPWITTWGTPGANAEGGPVGTTGQGGESGESEAQRREREMKAANRLGVRSSGTASGVTSLGSRFLLG
jgi:hypothetical protein